MSESKQLQSLGELPDGREQTIPTDARRVWPFLGWAMAFLFLALTYHYAFEVQPLARIALFKKAVRESNSDWKLLESRIQSLGFQPVPSPVRPEHVRIDLCPTQTSIKKLLLSWTAGIPILSQGANFVCTQVAIVHLGKDLKTLLKVEYTT